MGWAIEGTDSQENEVSFDVSFRVSDVGSTTVPTPDWLEEAREQTGN
jgi:hypothetical protein